jgi:hypothetical protein
VGNSRGALKLARTPNLNKKKKKKKNRKDFDSHSYCYKTAPLFQKKGGEK